MGERMVPTIDTPRMGMSAVKEMHLTESNFTITTATITNKRKSAPHTPPALNTGALLPHKSMAMRFAVEVCTLMADLTRPKVAMRMIADQVLMRERGEELNTLLVLMREEKEEDLSTLLALMMCRCHLTLLALMILPILQVSGCGLVMNSCSFSCLASPEVGNCYVMVCTLPFCEWGVLVCVACIHTVALRGYKG
jgi:hypothetical protein